MTNYKVWTEKEVNERYCLPDGEYKFIIEKSMETTSKNNGNLMWKLDLTIKYNSEVRKITDYIVMTDTMSWKLRHLAKCLDLLEKYESGTMICDDVHNKTGVLVLGSQNNEYNGVITKKNFVKDYIPVQILNQVSPTADEPDDTIPF